MFFCEPTDKKINEAFIHNIYQLPEKKMYVFSDKNLNKNLLVYIKEIKHVTIDKESKYYKNYFPIYMFVCLRMSYTNLVSY